jgi:hypothetical protein
MNEKIRMIAVWQYPIYLDYLLSFRLSKVLRFMKSDPVNNPRSSNPCTQYQECHPIQNQRSVYICLCSNNFIGANCSILDRMCADDFCSRNSLLNLRNNMMQDMEKNSKCSYLLLTLL